MTFQRDIAQTRTRQAWAWLVALALGAGACQGAAKKGQGGAHGGKEAAAGDGDAVALTDAQALAYLKDNCASCHGKGKDLHGTWPMPGDDELSVAALSAMDGMATAYQAMVNKASKAKNGQRPSPMPTTALDAAGMAQLKGFLRWTQKMVPAAVKEAESTYGASDQFGSTVAVNLNYSCPKRATGRVYLVKLFNEALGRPPTEKEMDDLLTAKELAQPISDAKRAELASLVTEGELKPQFLNYGLRIFAQKVGGAASIKANPEAGLSPAAANDLKLEFYQLLLSYLESKSYKDILLLGKVKVSPNTHMLYNSPETPCERPPDNSWGECDLSPARSNFFGTFGFLGSTPSSFLVSNNNYKRGGEIYAVLRGERLQAQTDGPTGGQPEPVPECLDTADERVVLNTPDNPDGKKAPRGAVAVPREGTVCQGCHLHKYLGVASYVFRPFDENGFAIPAALMNPDLPNNRYAAAVRMAIGPEIKNREGDDLRPMAPGVLQAFLNENAGGKVLCLTNRSGKKVKDVTTIGDLVGYIMGDGSQLVNGLSRFIPSAISNLPQTNQEVIIRVNKGWESGKGRLLPVFKQYFTSETFSCAP